MKSLKNSAFNKFLKLLNENSFLFTLILLIIIVVIVTAYKIKIQMEVGLMWDAFAFLMNAQFFAGHGFCIDLIRPVFLSFVTSLLFRIGYVSTVTISILDGAFFVLGVIGLFLFLKQRFNDLQSLLGSLIFISFPVVILWVGVGYTDIASTAISIWALYFTVLAVKKNPKFFYLVFPVLMLAFLTRFLAAILIFPILFYIGVNRSYIKNLKEISIGIFISLFIIAPVLIFWYKMTGNPFLPFLGTYTSTAGTAGSAVSKFAYNSDSFYYLKNALYCFLNLNFLNSPSLSVFISFISLEIFIIYSVAIGLVIYLHKILRIKRREFKNLENPLKSRKTKIIKGLMLFALGLLFIFSINKVNYLLSDLLFLILVYFIYKILKNDELKFLDIDFLVLIWLISYMIFNSVYQIKVCRYFIPMAPAVAYFMTLGITEFFTKIDSKLKKTNLSSILTVALMAIFLLFTGAYLYHIEHDPLANGSNFSLNHGKLEIKGELYSGELYFETYNTTELKTVANWLESYDPNYKNRVIYSDYFWPHLSWYLNLNVRSAKTRDTGEYLNNELKNQKADYYISMLHKVNLSDYIKVKVFVTNFGNITVYKRIDE